MENTTFNDKQLTTVNFNGGKKFVANVADNNKLKVLLHASTPRDTASLVKLVSGSSSYRNAASIKAALHAVKDAGIVTAAVSTYFHNDNDSKFTSEGDRDSTEEIFVLDGSDSDVEEDIMDDYYDIVRKRGVPVTWKHRGRPRDNDDLAQDHVRSPGGSVAPLLAVDELYQGHRDHQRGVQCRKDDWTYKESDRYNGKFRLSRFYLCASL
jgi:hypothetical protein